MHLLKAASVHLPKRNAVADQLRRASIVRLQTGLGEDFGAGAQLAAYWGTAGSSEEQRWQPVPETLSAAAPARVRAKRAAKLSLQKASGVLATRFRLRSEPAVLCLPKDSVLADIAEQLRLLSSALACRADAACQRQLHSAPQGLPPAAQRPAASSAVRVPPPPRAPTALHPAAAAAAAAVAARAEPDVPSLQAACTPSVVAVLSAVTAQSHTFSDDESGGDDSSCESLGSPAPRRRSVSLWNLAPGFTRAAGLLSPAGRARSKSVDKLGFPLAPSAHLLRCGVPLCAPVPASSAWARTHRAWISSRVQHAELAKAVPATDQDTAAALLGYTACTGSWAARQPLLPGAGAAARVVLRSIVLSGIPRLQKSVVYDNTYGACPNIMVFSTDAAGREQLLYSSLVSGSQRYRSGQQPAQWPVNVVVAGDLRVVLYDSGAAAAAAAGGSGSGGASGAGSIGTGAGATRRLIAQLRVSSSSLAAPSSSTDAWVTYTARGTGALGLCQYDDRFPEHWHLGLVCSSVPLGTSPQARVVPGLPARLAPRTACWHMCSNPACSAAHHAEKRPCWTDTHKHALFAAIALADDLLPEPAVDPAVQHAGAALLASLHDVPADLAQLWREPGSVQLPWLVQGAPLLADSVARASCDSAPSQAMARAACVALLRQQDSRNRQVGAGLPAARAVMRAALDTVTQLRSGDAAASQMLGACTACGSPIFSSAVLQAMFTAEDVSRVLAAPMPASPSIRPAMQAMRDLPHVEQCRLQWLAVCARVLMLHCMMDAVPLRLVSMVALEGLRLHSGLDDCTVVLQHLGRDFRRMQASLAEFILRVETQAAESGLPIQYLDAIEHGCDLMQQLAHDSAQARATIASVSQVDGMHIPPRLIMRIRAEGWLTENMLFSSPEPELYSAWPLAGAPGTSGSSSSPVRCAPATDEQAGETCVVCMDDVEAGQPCATLPCEHVFHHACITPWVASHSSCPLCKAPLGVPESAEPSAEPVPAST